MRWLIVCLLLTACDNKKSSCHYFGTEEWGQIVCRDVQWKVYPSGRDCTSLAFPSFGTFDVIVNGNALYKEAECGQ